MNMYFLAIVCPEQINREVLQWKHWMRDRFGCIAALRSPAHITLVPPFWMEAALEKNMIDKTDLFCSKLKPFAISVTNFAAFKPRVIFVDVLKNEILEELQSDISEFLIAAGEFPVQKDERAFHPHITIATRDLHKRSFAEAWEFFAKKEYHAGWMAEGISLLKHNKKNWDVIHTSRFSQ